MGALERGSHLTVVAAHPDANQVGPVKRVTEAPQPGGA